MNLAGVIRLNKHGLTLICVTFILFVIYVFFGMGSVKRTSTQTVNIKELIAVAIKAAENGGIEITGSTDDLQVKSKGKTLEGVDDKVTSADYYSHCAMVETLRNSFDDINIISEEIIDQCDQVRKINHGLQEANSQLDKLPNFHVNRENITIWIDPLDATYEFTEKLYDFVTTMVCIAVDGQPTVGVIHKPFSKDKVRTFWAWNENFIKYTNVETKRPDASAKSPKTIIISRTHSGQIREILSSKMKDYELVVAAGAGYKALKVATGEVDAYLHVTAIKKWDICAGNAIINAMNGRMTTTTNETITYNNFKDVKNTKGLIAALGENHNFFVNLFK